MQLVARYMPTDRPQHRAELLRKLVLYRFKTTSVADFEAAFAGLRELHDQARDVDPSRTEADFDAAVPVSIQNTPGRSVSDFRRYWSPATSRCGPLFF